MEPSESNTMMPVSYEPKKPVSEKATLEIIGQFFFFLLGFSLK